MLDLWLVRHAESLGNLDGTASDTELSELGVGQARTLRHLLADTAFATVWASPLRRAMQTAALALPGVAPVVDPRLTELQSSRTPTFVDTSNPVELQRLLQSAPLTSESGKDFMARVGEWRNALPPEGSVIAFTHFGVVREIIALLLGFRRAPQSMGYAAVFRFAVRGDAVDIVAWNHTPSEGPASAD